MNLRAITPLAHRENMIGWIYDRALNISFDDGKLYAGIEGSENRLELIPSAPNRFVMAGFDQRVGVAEVVFHRESDANTSSMTLELTGARSFYQRVPAPTGSR